MKHFFICLALFLSVNSFAQFQKGTRTVGFNIGGISFTGNSTSYEQQQVGTGKTATNNFNVSLNPSMGWFVSENVLIGGNIGVNFSSTKKDGGGAESKSNTITIGVGPFARYYFGNSGFLPYVQASIFAGFGSGKGSGTSTLTGQTTKWEEDQKGIFNINAGGGFGVTKMIGKNIGFDLGLGLAYISTSYNYSYIANTQFTAPPSSTRSENKGKYTNNAFNVNASVGFQIFLDPKK